MVSARQGLSESHAVSVQTSNGGDGSLRTHDPDVTVRVNARNIKDLSKDSSSFTYSSYFEKVCKRRKCRMKTCKMKNPLSDNDAVFSSAYLRLLQQQDE